MKRLIIRPGAIGDCILSLPALEHLRTDDTEIWVPSPIVPLIRCATRVRSIASTGMDLLGIPGVQEPPSLVEYLKQFDSIVSWYGANREEFRECVRQLDLPFQFFRALPDSNCQVHCADFFAQQVGAPTPAIPRIDCGPIERARNAQIEQSFAVIHPFSGSPRKNWPLDKFRAVAANLPLPVYWCAGPEEELDGAVRFDDLFQLAQWLASAALYIGNDCGITHLAAAVGTPVIAIFGPTDPAVWGPRGENVHIACGELQPDVLAAFNPAAQNRPGEVAETSQQPGG